MSKKIKGISTEGVCLYDSLSTISVLDHTSAFSLYEKLIKDLKEHAEHNHLQSETVDVLNTSIQELVKQMTAYALKPQYLLKTDK